MNGNEVDAVAGEEVTATEATFKGTRTRVAFARVRVVERSAGRLFRNHRLTFCQETDEGLAENIRTHGLLEPIIVRAADDGWYDLVAGERRVRSIKALIDAKASCLDLREGRRRPAAEVYDEVDALVVEVASDLEMLEISVAENLHTHPVSDFDLMIFCTELAREHPRKVVCKLLNKSPSYLSTMLDLAEFPQEILDLFRQGSLSRRACINLLKVKPDRLMEAIRLGGEVTRRDAAREAALAAAELERLEGPQPVEEDEDMLGAAPAILGRVEEEAQRKRMGPGHRDVDEILPPPPPIKNKSKRVRAARKRLEAAEEKGMSGGVSGEGIARVLQERPDLLREDRAPQPWTPRRISEAAEELEAAIANVAGNGMVEDPTKSKLVSLREAQLVLLTYQQVLGRGPVSPFALIEGSREVA